jgi:hypothetical protein
MAGVVTPERYDKNMEFRKTIQETFLGAVLRRKQIEDRGGILIVQKLARLQRPVQLRGHVKLTLHDGVRGATSNDKVFTYFIDKNLTAGIQADELKRQ